MRPSVLLKVLAQWCWISSSLPIPFCSSCCWQWCCCPPSHKAKYWAILALLGQAIENSSHKQIQLQVSIEWTTCIPVGCWVPSDVDQLPLPFPTPIVPMQGGHEVWIAGVARGSIGSTDLIETGLWEIELRGKRWHTCRSQVQPIFGPNIDDNSSFSLILFCVQPFTCPTGSGFFPNAVDLFHPLILQQGISTDSPLNVSSEVKEWTNWCYLGILTIFKSLKWSLECCHFTQFINIGKSRMLCGTEDLESKSDRRPPLDSYSGFFEMLRTFWVPAGRTKEDILLQTHLVLCRW